MAATALLRTPLDPRKGRGNGERVSAPPLPRRPRWGRPLPASLGDGTRRSGGCGRGRHGPPPRCSARPWTPGRSAGVASASARLSLRAALVEAIRSLLPWATGRNGAEGGVAEVAAATALLRGVPDGISCTPPSWASGRTPLPPGHLWLEKRRGGGGESGGRGHSSARLTGRPAWGGAAAVVPAARLPFRGALGGASRLSPPWAGGSRAEGGRPPPPSRTARRRPRGWTAAIRARATRGRPLAVHGGRTACAHTSAASRRRPLARKGHGGGAASRPAPAPLATSRGLPGRSRGSQGPRPPDPWRSGGPRPPPGRSTAAFPRPGVPRGPSYLPRQTGRGQSNVQKFQNWPCRYFWHRLCINTTRWPTYLTNYSHFKKMTQVNPQSKRLKSIICVFLCLSLHFRGCCCRCPAPGPLLYHTIVSVAGNLFPACHSLH